MTAASHYSDPLTAEHWGKSRKSGDTDEFNKIQMMKKIVQHCLELHLPKMDVLNLLALAQIKSGFNPDAANKYTDASGLFQIKDDTAQDVIDRLNGKESIPNYTEPPYNRFDPDSNIDFAISIYFDNKNRASSADIRDIYKQYNPGVNEQELTKVKNTFNKFYKYFRDQEVTIDALVTGYWSVNYIPVIDSWHKKENERLKQSFNSFKNTTTAGPPRRDPLILDLNGDGIKTISLSEDTQFDHDGNGFAEQTGWVDPNDGLLVLDRNGGGIINDGKELFGDQTILANGQRATDGFHPLAKLDGNGDGQIDTNDAAYTQLRVWRDEEGDGCSLPGELHTLQELGIASINVTGQATNVTDENGNILNFLGSFQWSDGTNGQAGSYGL